MADTTVWTESSRHVYDESAAPFFDDFICLLAPNSHWPEALIYKPRHAHITQTYATVAPALATVASAHATIAPAHATIASSHATIASSHATIAPAHGTALGEHTQPLRRPT